MAATAAPSPALVLKRIRAESAARAQHSTAALGTETSTGKATQHDSTYLGRTAAGAGSPGKNSPAASLRLPSFPIPALQQLVARHFRSSRAPELVVGGHRPLALVYLLVATLIAAPLRQTVVVVDVEARFDVRLLLGVQPTASAMYGADGDEGSVDVLASPVIDDDLQHVHVFRVDPRWRVPLAELVAAAEQRVLYGAQRRRDRPWWGTIVVGGAGGGGVAATGASNRASDNALSHGVGAALVTGAYGWLRVDCHEPDAVESYNERHERLLAFFKDVDLNNTEHDDEAPNTLLEDESGTHRVEPVIWVARSPWGCFRFQLSKSARGREANDDEPPISAAT
ncbi:hypothetical protein HMPREF1624_06691 [Sporothrix schenckii ATCC 58251]|uniref:Uncharacterized protein n=1 Tax=Sporothrix schenckii (strain ATCC 58251 / de Perez 2211183) TaxID=1391915 RepID=U7PRJ0_SPOS1|nr:hypothetical protein HMPREF1624_06691 [Sporothrix schenckii ATCC 58251]